MTEDTKRCATCRHWTGLNDDGLGECLAPKPEAMSMMDDIQEILCRIPLINGSKGTNCYCWEKPVP